MKSSPLRRLLVVLLCVQPVFWMSNVALAQTFVPQRIPGQSGAAASNTGEPGTPTGGDLLPPGSGVTQQFGMPGIEPEPLNEPRTATPTVPHAIALDEPVDPDKYVLAHGDVLELHLWGVQNLSFRVTVDVEGRIFVPKVGYFDLRNRTVSEARRIVGSGVGKYYRLSFGFSLAEPRTFLVQVVDDVLRPGSYPARATDRVAAVIARAGGPGKSSSLRRIEIRRRDGKVIPVDLLLYSITGNVKYNPYLLDGDVVRVPFEELVARIEGAVNRPGRYELIGSRDLAELVELAGGLAPQATKALPISITRRTEGDKQQRFLVDWAEGKVPAAPLKYEDTARISNFADIELSVLVVGAVAGATATGANVTAAGPARSTTILAAAPEEASATRRVPFASGDTVRSILDRVGGVGPLADLRRSYISRGDRAIPVNLEALVMLRDPKADQEMQLGDVLVIPFQRRNIAVEGAVFAPGLYPYNPTFGIDHYISLAGGRNRFAQSISEVRLVAPDGTTKEFSSSLKVEPGSSIVVPERNFSRTEVVQIILGVAGIVLSSVAVVIAASK